MSTVRVLRLFCASLAALFTFVFAAPAFAAPPAFQTVPLDATFIDDNATSQCGFPVEVHVVGTLEIATHALRDGTVAELDHLRQASFTFTNLSTGTSYTSKSARQNRIVIQPDGTVKVAATGVIALITLPGEGLLLKDVGRIVDINGVTVFQAGTHPLAQSGDVQGLCTALS